MNYVLIEVFGSNGFFDFLLLARKVLGSSNKQWRRQNEIAWNVLKITKSLVVVELVSLALFIIDGCRQEEPRMEHSKQNQGWS